MSNHEDENHGDENHDIEKDSKRHLDIRISLYRLSTDDISISLYIYLYVISMQ
jgi:hypothetical protein